MLVFSRIISSSSKRSSLKEANGFLEAPKCDLHQIYRSFEILSKENDFIQSERYANSKDVLQRKTNILYYDCTNYYFEIEEDVNFRKNGISKEHKFNPIVHVNHI